MSTITKARPRVKPARSLRLVQPMNRDGRWGLLRIAIGKEVFLYGIDRIPADFGHGFRLRKHILVTVVPGMWESKTGECYDVNLDGTGSRCECLGHLKRGHCKHVDALRKLQQLGLI